VLRRQMGKDASKAFNDAHAEDEKPRLKLAQYKVRTPRTKGLME
jgi:cytochrome b involved in lipid metabolism